MKHLFAYLTLPILLLLAATGCSREEMAPDNEPPAGTFRIETRVAGTNESLPDGTKYVLLQYGGNRLKMKYGSYLPGHIVAGNIEHSVFLYATIGGDALTVVGDETGNPYSDLKLSLTTTSEGVANVPYLLYDKQQLTGESTYSLLLRSPMATLRFRLDGIGVSLYKSIELRVKGVPTTFVPSKDVSGQTPYEGSATLIVSAPITDTYKWAAATPTFPISGNMTCEFVCTLEDGTTKTFDLTLPKTEAGKVYDYQFDFEHEIRLSTVSVKDWTPADIFDGHADPV